MGNLISSEEGFFKCDSLNAALELVEQAADSDAMISIHDPQGMYRYASSSFKKILGYDANELLGNSAYDYFHPEDFQSILKTHAKVSIRPEVEEVSYRIKSRDGRYLNVSSLSRTIKVEGEPEFIIALTVLEQV